MNVLLTIDGKDIIMPISKDAVDLSDISDSLCSLLDKDSIAMNDVLGVVDEKYHDHPCLKQLPNEKEFDSEDLSWFLFEDEFSLSNTVDSYVEQAYQEKFGATVVGGYMCPEYYNLTDEDKDSGIFLKCSVDTEISDFKLIEGKEINWDSELSKSYWRKYQKHLELEKQGGAKLYWVETHDHDEDWFIIAQSSYAAKKFHNNFEGYGFEGYSMNCESLGIRAIPLCIVPPDIYVKYAELSVREDENVFLRDFAFHAQFDILEELGAKIVSEKEPRIVQIDNIVFKEGKLQSEINHINNMIINKDLN